MSKMDPKAKAAPAQPMFVPKFDNPDAPTELTLDEAMAKAAELYREFAPLKAALEQIKVVVKAHLKAKGLTNYQDAAGNKALFYSQNRTEYNKELLKELLADKYASVVTIKPITSFKITVPGVKSPDAD